MRHVCGLDVHKDSVFVCILNEKGVVFQEKFGVLTPELERMVGVIMEHGVTEVGMESTSVYWMPVWRVIDPYVEQNLVNPYFIRQLPGKKSDVVDAIARGETSPDALLRCVHGRIVNRHGADVIRSALTGVITPVDVDVIRQLREEIELARRHRDECQRRMDGLCSEWFPEQYANLQTIPGVKARSATAIIAELGTDMSSFEDAAHLVSWAGLRPRNDESAGRIKARGITHGNKYLRKTLIECAWGASRTRGCFYSRFSHHQTVVRRKSRMKVQVAIARKMLSAIWFILHDGVAYRDFEGDANAA